MARLQDFELNQQLYITHGDLCFNNVLADPIHHLIKLIDPRGEMPDTNRDMEVDMATYAMILPSWRILVSFYMIA